MADYTFRLACDGDRNAVAAFVRKHWKTRHPLVELPDFFDYYYKAESGSLRFALAEDEHGKLAALAGYTPANMLPQPDVWVSLWVADPAARGSGLALMDALPSLTGCRTLACNNIRPETMPFYDFLGYTSGRVGHYYRLALRESYAIARIACRDIPPVTGEATLSLLPDEAALLASGFTSPDANPYKDLWYITRRYFHYPRQHTPLYAATLPGDTAPRGLLAARRAPALGSAALRIVDYIGPPALLAQLGPAIDGLLAEAGAEYVDIYCAGLPEDVLRGAGFTARLPDDPNIIPTYLDPPLIENIDYYYFTSRPQGFTLFKADGDQDRPNIPL